MSKLHLLVIDPQVDFMDLSGSALPVPGAGGDMTRLAAMIDRLGPKLDDVHCTLDSHRVIDIAHPGMWVDEDGNHPAPYTIITPSDLRSGLWKPRNAMAKPPELDGKTIGQYVLEYAEKLEAGGNYPLMVWPEHCLIGSPGHAVHEGLLEAFQRWERRNFANVDYTVKGVNLWTEHYGGLMAEVPLSNDPSTGLNTGLLDMLANADIILVAGEALSHCVRATVTQIADHIGDEHVRKFYILTDCSSPVPKIGDGPDFPTIAAAWLKEMESRGMNLTTSAEFLA